MVSGKFDYDLIVVGASFAGCVAGKIAAEKGLKTLIVERSYKPGEKIVSGTGLPILVFQDFPWVAEAPLERPWFGVVSHFLRDGKIEVTVKVERYDFPFCYGIYCQPFVEFLARKAVEAGAELKTSTVAVDVIKEDGFIRGIITDSGEKFRSKIVVAADGVWSLIGIKAGIRKKFSPSDMMHGLWLDFEMPSEKDLDEALGGNYFITFWDLDGKLVPPPGISGYFGIFPYKKSFHFGIGVSVSFLAEVGLNFEDIYRKFFELDYWRKNFGKAKLRAKMWRPYPIYGGLDREQKGMDKTYGNGILIAGDAAGFEASSQGDGIHTAMLSGKMAAEVAVEAVSKGDYSAEMLKKYEELWKSSIIARRLKDYGRKNLIQYAGNPVLMKRGILEIYSMPVFLGLDVL